MNPFLKFAVHVLVNSLAGMSRDQFAEVRSRVVDQMTKLTASATKAAYVRDFIKSLLPSIAGWAANMVLELAVAWVKRERGAV